MAPRFPGWGRTEAKCRNWESSVVKGSSALGRGPSRGTHGGEGDRVSEARIEVGSYGERGGGSTKGREEERAIRRD